MDLNSFITNPIDFISNLANVSDIKPDFGLNNAINEAVANDPSLLEKIPLVSTLGHLQLYPPNTLIRLRCSFLMYHDEEYLPLRVFFNNKYYTPWTFSGEFPAGTDLGDERNMIQRLKILVSSIPCLTHWLRDIESPDPISPSSHCTIDSNQVVSTDDLFEESFQAIVSFAFEIPEKPSIPFDLIAVMHDVFPLAAEMRATSADAFISSIPSFVAFAAFPVKSLFSPPLPSPGPTLLDIRSRIISIFNNIFEPFVSELLLLYLIGRVSSRDPQSQQPIGLFSLNLFGVSPAAAAAITQLLSFVCTSINIIHINRQSLNQKPLSPGANGSEYNTTQLSAVTETRLIIDETQMSDGNLNQNGLSNIQILQDLINFQHIPMLFEVYTQTIEVSFPTLVLSTHKSLLKTNISIPIGEIKTFSFELNKVEMDIIRSYIENVRFNEFGIKSEEAENFVKSQMQLLLSSNAKVTQDELNLLMNINRLNSMSIGVNDFNPQVWERTAQLFMKIMEFKAN
ncbi:mini-chromosome maintenance complex-binding protein [Histomonas meleagridis]|uniref:mini-chromosome maintenance complex-binding protein n=1 Tax=Histomonas meleagridis TaxID=135588 RepID=UPI003559E481|nr:mini-chromosome maintenance complex-binding protein [Histomonas meleagridis]KAH0804112.1 mini-chromosome maintenance complex-binding protein [Histomonas meleagridis]